MEAFSDAFIKSENQVINLQNFLRFISSHNVAIRPIIVTGKYDNKTKEAVSDFQSMYGIVPNGIVDLKTWNRIVEVSDDLKRKYEIKPFNPFIYDEILIVLGDNSIAVTIIQLIRNELSKKYVNFEDSSITGEYDNKTSEFIKTVQQLEGLRVTGNTDNQTWNALIDLYEKTKV